ncbi:Putative nuclease HARBI1 [Eumeta japonica]|uniref:Nuclease HARBI1 n=1 Tax=Eumeta variegata TaxID=151549 RepID=A0A4C1VRZ0_EUMVA|nr:Putative nuclease HARBI1 [Eumeta japonica]
MKENLVKKPSCISRTGAFDGVKTLKAHLVSARGISGLLDRYYLYAPNRRHPQTGAHCGLGRRDKTPNTAGPGTVRFGFPFKSALGRLPWVVSLRTRSLSTPLVVFYHQIEDRRPRLRLVSLWEEPARGESNKQRKKQFGGNSNVARPRRARTRAALRRALPPGRMSYVPSECQVLIYIKLDYNESNDFDGATRGHVCGGDDARSGIATALCIVRRKEGEEGKKRKREREMWRESLERGQGREPELGDGIETGIVYKMARALMLMAMLDAEENRSRCLETSRLRRQLRFEAAAQLSEPEFQAHYRLSKELFLLLCSELKPLMERSRRHTKISVECKVLTALAFYASGSNQKPVGMNYLHALSQSSVSNSIKEVTQALNHPTILNKYIKFPQTCQERNVIIDGFYNEFGFPGDSGYPLRPWLLTPVTDATPHTATAHYTSLHCKTRNVIERCIGVLKARWRCLLAHRVLHYNDKTVAKMINACVVLHNIANRARLPVDFPSDEISRDSSRQVAPSVPPNNLDMNLDGGLQTRNFVIQRLWNWRQ